MAKKTMKKSTKKKTTKKTVKKTASAKPVKITAPAKPYTKSETYNTIAEHTDIPKKQVAAAFEVLSEIIGKHLGKRGPGVFTLPGLMKLTVKRKPATKARKGINPFTGEQIMIKAKPARNVVRVRPLKNLNEMV